MTDAASSPSFEPAFLASALRGVRLSYQTHNATHFDGALRLPTFEWSDSSRELGAWISQLRLLRLSRQLLLSSWGGLNEVLLHEMAHQYVDEVLGVRDEVAHGPSFRRICQEKGIDGRAMGAPGPELTESSRSVIERISRLLALAQSENQHEAEAAMSAARRLMLKHNLGQLESGSAQPSGYGVAHLGAPLCRRPAWLKLLAVVLSEFFFVEAIFVPAYRPEDGKEASLLELCGTPANLEMASYAHDFLCSAVERLSREHFRGQRASPKERQSYAYGVLAGFRQKLLGEQKKCQTEGLVWVGDPELRHYFRRRHPRIRATAAGSSLAAEAYGAGQAAGKNLVLHRGMKQSSSGVQGPHLLPPRKRP